jgi:hypothetical protein
MHLSRISGHPDETQTKNIKMLKNNITSGQGANKLRTECSDPTRVSYGSSRAPWTSRRSSTTARVWEQVTIFLGVFTPTLASALVLLIYSQALWSTSISLIKSLVSTYIKEEEQRYDSNIPTLELAL